MPTKTKASDESKVQPGDAPYKGTLRIVTEADILGDPRLVAASVVVGQLYDFSNLSKIESAPMEAVITEMNEKKEASGDTEEGVAEDVEKPSK